MSEAPLYANIKTRIFDQAILSQPNVCSTGQNNEMYSKIDHCQKWINLRIEAYLLICNSG